MTKHLRALLIGSVLAVGAVSMRSTQNTDVHGAPSSPPDIEQRATVTTAPDGTFVWTFPQPYPFGVEPIITSLAVAQAGSPEVVNVQLDGKPTNTQAKFRVTMAQHDHPPGEVLLHVTARSP